MWRGLCLSSYIWFVSSSCLQYLYDGVVWDNLQVKHLLEKCGEILVASAPSSVANECPKNVLIWYDMVRL